MISQRKSSKKPTKFDWILFANSLKKLVLWVWTLKIAAGLEDDLNMSAALGATFDLVRELNIRVAARSMSTADARRGIEAIRELDTVLGVLGEAGDELDAELAAMLEARIAARAERDWARSDELRDSLAAVGIVVEDSPDGQRWRRS